MRPLDIRLVEFDQSAPFAYLAANGVLRDEVEVEWDRIRFRDNSKVTKEAALGRRHDTRLLYQHVDSVIDAHNTQKPYQLPVFAYYGTNRAVDVPKNRMLAKSMPQSFRRLMGLENALASKTNFGRAVGWFDLLERRELREQRDKMDISEASYCLDAVRRALESMIPQMKNPRIDSTTGRFAVDTVDPAGTPIRLHLDQLSDGYQVMLGVVMDFALRLALANPPQSPDEDVLKTEALLMIDEVDLHLHPLWQQRVIPDLQRTFPNTQLILTTHSPQVATTVPSQSLRILKEGKLHDVPAGTEGAEAERLLVDVFGAPTRSPHVRETELLAEYMRLVDANQADSPRALQLRSDLDAWSQGNEPLLKRLDVRIANRKWAQK
jgi:predicted ATP-binding protein involved in virulence